MSKTYLEAFSRLSPLDWCSLLEEEGPKGILGAPPIARLCGYDHSGLGVELHWEGVSIGRGLKAILGAPPKYDLKAPPGRPREPGSGECFNPLLHPRILPAQGESGFPGCVELDGRLVGVPDLEPLQSRSPCSCSKRAPRASGPPSIGGARIVGAECTLASTPGGRRVISCLGGGATLLYSEGQAVARGPLALEVDCADYRVGVLHPGGPVYMYATHSVEVEANAITVECPTASLYASSPWGVRLRASPGRLEVEGLQGRPYALGSGGPLRAARSLFELLTPPDSRGPEGGLGHARCANCAGSSLVDGETIWFYAWTPAGSPGILELRFSKPVAPRVLVVDALGEDWVPVERGLTRIPLPPGWHVVAAVELEKRGIAEILRERLGRARG